ncbi:hypothetical protein LCGC14_0571240 [marine sediment metagenome]|uniref:Uncharacterized protein n=1 Tax=marine sediment metagenome TaxID=412755 RepID=A0A0F9U5G8_9ZZZZ
MKSNIWIDKHNQADTIEIIVRDQNKRKLERWVIDINDKRRAKQIVSSLKSSYGINLGSVDIDEDLSWLNQN